MVKRSLKELITAIIMIGLTMSLFSLWGCIPKLSSHQQEPDFDEIASQIMKAFEEDSIDPIKGILSKSALESSDLLLGINYGHELLKSAEKIVLENEGGYEGDGWEKGKYYKWDCCYYNATTENQVFKLSFQFFSQNELYPEDTGLFRVFFATEDEDRNETKRFKDDLSGSTSDLHWNYGATYERAGIYNPEWQTTPPPDDYKGQRY